jgi:hypothetical protein
MRQSFCHASRRLQIFFKTHLIFIQTGNCHMTFYSTHPPGSGYIHCGAKRIRFNFHIIITIKHAFNYSCLTPSGEFHYIDIDMQSLINTSTSKHPDSPLVHLSSVYVHAFNDCAPNCGLPDRMKRPVLPYKAYGANDSFRC